MKQKKQQRPLQWHPAFYADLQIELDSEKQNLIYENEHQLGTKPLEIDVLIIKNKAEEPIFKNIGRIFKDIILLSIKVRMIMSVLVIITKYMLTRIYTNQSIIFQDGK